GVRDDATFFVLIRAMLDERADGNDEEAAGETQRTEQRHYLDERKAMQGNEASENGHADAAQRNQAIFDLSAGEVAGSETADADADSQRGLQIAAARLVETENFATIENNDELQQSSEKPKIGVTDDGEFQRAIGTYEAPLRSEIGKNVEAKFFGGVAGGNAGDQQAGEASEYGQPGENHAGPGFPSAEGLREKRPKNRARNDGDEGGELENAVAPGELFVREQFREQAIL